MADTTDPHSMAFPNEPCETGNQEWGLTKREWFAGMALAGMPLSVDVLSDVVAGVARLRADALIAELNKEPEK